MRTDFNNLKILSKKQKCVCGGDDTTKTHNLLIPKRAISAGELMF